MTTEQINDSDYEAEMDDEALNGISGGPLNGDASTALTGCWNPVPSA